MDLHAYIGTPNDSRPLEEGNYLLQTNQLLPVAIVFVSICESPLEFLQR